jgi:hypothetical protein
MLLLIALSSFLLIILVGNDAHCSATTETNACVRTESKAFDQPFVRP